MNGIPHHGVSQFSRPIYGVKSSIRQSVCLCAGIREELGQLEWPVFQLQTPNGEVSVTACAFNYASVVENTKFSLYSVLGTRAVEASVIPLVPSEGEGWAFLKNPKITAHFFYCDTRGAPDIWEPELRVVWNHGRLAGL